MSTLHRYAGPPQPHPPHLPSPTSLTCPAPHLFSPPQPPPRFTSVPRPASAHPASPPQPHPVSLPSPKHPQQWPLLQHRSCPSSTQAPAAASPAASAARPLKQPAPRSPAPAAAARPPQQPAGTGNSSSPAPCPPATSRCPLPPLGCPCPTPSQGPPSAQA